MPMQSPSGRSPSTLEHLQSRHMGVPRRLMQGITMVLAAALLNTALLPLTHAQQLQSAQAAQTAQARALELAAAPTAADRYHAALQALKSSMLDAADGSTRAQSGNLRSSAVFGGPAAFETLAQTLREDWAQLRTQWSQSTVPQEVLARQAELQAAFEKKHGELIALLAQPPSADRNALLQSYLSDNVPVPTHHKVNLNNLPWQVQKTVQREPLADAQALDAKLLAAAGAPAGNQPLAKTSRVAQTALLKNAAAPTAADLGPTLDAPHTDAIKSLSQTLGNNPHKIYQWVHDNIYYHPSQGSVQGAQDTLDKKSGNAFDQASLLIALLRSAGVPARYVYGSVEMPADKVMNWVGGAKTVDAAQQILSQGGVPNIALVSGGQIKTMRLEHVWVEAYVNYHPGRGATHKGGQTQGDTWVPMDGSYKQYTFKEGMDLQSAVPLDAQALLTAAQQGADTNQAEGWVRNLNTAALQSQLSSYQSRLKTYIDSQNAGQSTVGDVLGTRQATIDPLPYLAGTLPYTIKARSQQFSAVPGALQAKFRYQIYSDARSATWGDNPLMSFEAPTAALAGKKLTLAWVAASTADEAAIAALFPKPAPGQPLDPAQLPRSLSSSISLKPQILVDGEIKAQGPGMRAGSEPVGAGAFTRYGATDWDETTDGLIAGQQTGLGLSIQGISQTQLQQLKTRMEATQQKLQQAQAAPEAQRVNILQGMTGDQLTGDLLTATLWGYFAAVQSHGAIASAQAQMIDRPALSYGLFHAQVRPNKLYGIVTTGITFQGLNMDIGHMRSIRWVKDDNPQSPINAKPELTQNGKSAAQNRWIAYNKMRGQYASAMEHAVPEQFWVDKSQCRYDNEQGQVHNPTKADCAQAVSAVKAIAIAQAEGQRIYTIDQSNAVTALPQLPVGGTVGEEIRSAIQAGKEVTVHGRQISAHGFTGFGYIITDPQTGAGAYLIEGMGNGGILFALGIFIIGMILAMLPALVASGGAAIAAIAPLLVLGIGALLMGAALLKIIDGSFCKVGLGIIVGTSLASISSIILIPAVGAASASVMAGLLNVILGSNAMRALGGIYGWFVGDNLCKS